MSEPPNRYQSLLVADARKASWTGVPNSGKQGVMKITRATKCSLKFASRSKLTRLKSVLVEYGRVVNVFIDAFWMGCPGKGELLKPVVDLPQTWLTARLRKVAAREAIDMVQAARRRHGAKAVKPIHKGRRMCV